MKFFVVFALLFAAVAVYAGPVAQESDPQLAVSDVSGDGSASSSVAQQQNLPPADIAEIQAILTETVGPELSDGLTRLVVKVSNRVLKGVPINSILQPVIQIVTRNGDTVENLLAGSGQQGSLTPADQAKLVTILSRTLGRYTASNIVKIVALTANGQLPTNVGKLIGLEGLGAPVGELAN